MSFKVQSAASLFTPEEHAAHKAYLAEQGARYAERINDKATAQRDLIRKESGERAAKKFETFALALKRAETFATTPDSTPEWQVPDLIPRTGSGLHSGASGSLKSFAQIWLGDQVNQNGGEAVLVIAEGAQGFKRRLRAYSEHTGVPLSELPAVLPFAVDLSDKDSVIGFIGALKVLHPDVTYIAFDTKWRCSGSLEENSATDQAKLFAHVDLIAREFKAFCMLVAHLGKNEQLGVRGSNSQYAAVDIELRQDRQESTCTLRTEKNKDGRDDIQRVFNVVEVDLGTNARGEGESSLVLVESDKSIPSKGKVKGPHERAALDLLRAAPCQAMHEADLIKALVEKGGRSDNIKKRTIPNLIGKRLAFHDGTYVSLNSSIVQGEGDWLE